MSSSLDDGQGCDILSRSRSPADTVPDADAVSEKNCDLPRLFAKKYLLFVAANGYSKDDKVAEFNRNFYDTIENDEQPLAKIFIYRLRESIKEKRKPRWVAALKLEEGFEAVEKAHTKMLEMAHIEKVLLQKIEELEKELCNKSSECVELANELEEGKHEISLLRHQLQSAAALLEEAKEAILKPNLQPAMEGMEENIKGLGILVGLAEEKGARPRCAL